MTDKGEQFQREAERVQAEVQRFVASEAESTSVELPDGSAMKVEKVGGPAGGMRYAGAGGLSGRSYPALPERPPDYPEGFPFAPGAAVLVQEMADQGMTSLFWWGAADSLGVLATVEAQLLREGWARGEAQDLPQAGAVMTSYRKGEDERMLMGGGDLVMLIEKRPTTG